MPPTNITCPRCQNKLKLPPAVPAGFKPKCPQCGTYLVLPGGNGAGAAPGAVAARKPAAAIMTAKAVPPPANGRRPVASSPDDDGISTSPSSSGKRRDPLAVLGVILGSALLLVFLTVVLLIICFRDEPTADNTAKDAEPQRDPAIVDLQTNLKPLKQKGPAPKPLIVLSKENQQKVDDATKRGVDYLIRAQIQDGPDKGRWKAKELQENDGIGLTALAGLTLLECQVPDNDVAIQSAAQYVRKSVKLEMGGHETYEVSLAVLFLSRLDHPSDRELIRWLALRLVAGQKRSGGWTYRSLPLTEPQQAEVIRLLSAWPNSQSPGGSLLPPDVFPMGAFQEVPKNVNPDFYKGNYQGIIDTTDNSNTQFALLALWAARRYGLPLDPVLQLVAKRFRSSQEPDGNWNYSFNHKVSSNPTMTAAGLLGLAVGYGLEKDGKISGNMAEDKVLKDGFRALSNRVGNPGQGLNESPEMYFLWSVERVAVLYHLDRIEGKDWYHWGLEILLPKQEMDGKWHMKNGVGSFEVVDTCFALLFLQRANLIKDLTDKIQQLLAALRAPQKKE